MTLGDFRLRPRHVAAFAQFLHDEADLEGELASLAGCDDCEAVAEVPVRTAVNHPRLCTLASVVSSVLEQNIA